MSKHTKRQVNELCFPTWVLLPVCVLFLIRNFSLQPKAQKPVTCWREEKRNEKRKKIRTKRKKKFWNKKDVQGRNTSDLQIRLLYVAKVLYIAYGLGILRFSSAIWLITFWSFIYLIRKIVTSYFFILKFYFLYFLYFHVKFIWSSIWNLRYINFDYYHCYR